VSGDDLYALLGVPHDASRAQIGQAYRQRAHSAHPDTQPADPTAAARFRTLTHAYHVLGDPTRRAAYDRALDPSLRILPPPPMVPRDVPVRPVSLVLSNRPAPSPLSPAHQSIRPLLWAGPVHVEPSATARVVDPQVTAPLTPAAQWMRLLAAWLDELEWR
jgi:hypothetical protein